MMIHEEDGELYPFKEPMSMTLETFIIVYRNNPRKRAGDA